jgi:hypothetical protein
LNFWGEGSEIGESFRKRLDLVRLLLAMALAVISLSIMICIRWVGKEDSLFDFVTSDPQLACWGGPISGKYVGFVHFAPLCSPIEAMSHDTCAFNDADTGCEDEYPTQRLPLCELPVRPSWDLSTTLSVHALTSSVFLFIAPSEAG